MLSKDALRQLLDAEVGTVADAARRLVVLHTERDSLTQDVDAKIAAAEAQQAAALEAISRLLEDKEVQKLVLVDDKRTARLPHGDVKLTASTSLIIDDLAKAFAWLRKHHVFRRFTRFKERELDKVAIKAEKGLAEKIPGVHLETADNLKVIIPGVSAPFERLLGDMKAKLKK